MDALGDPTFFMTNSHADTYCPYLAKYIKVHAQIEDGAVNDPENPALNDNYARDARLGKKKKNGDVDSEDCRCS